MEKIWANKIPISEQILNLEKAVALSENITLFISIVEVFKKLPSVHLLNFAFH